ncbi:Binding-protein-dependent transport systems inner membrane component [Sodalis praecaptivus]|uniref:Binding-protein-dependent transport systems inner membrane component n=1 Tax=Sodalis praecaptivus TaxID=1239307 RepID=W0HWL2_9GAMM|nr:ABC transporter permease [Sodalis praecaptivus]AHF76585.1 Binding-protein-dependent transport systems inner membrane component [Sodalis praecaptivus]
MTQAVDDFTRRGPRDRLRLLCGQRRYGLIYLVSILAGMMIWLAISRHFAGFILAPPHKVIERLWELTLSARLPLALLDASRHMLLGFAIALVIALPLGMLMGRHRVIHDVFDPLVTLIYAVPSVAWAPFIMIWFGLYFEARVALVVIMCLFDMLIIIDAGTRNVDRRLLDVGRAFNATRRQQIRLILIPESLPFLFTALRIGAVRAVNAMITAELFLATVNLGAIMKQSAARFDSAGVLGVLFVLCVLGLLLQEILLILERRVCRWLPREAQ